MNGKGSAASRGCSGRNPLDGMVEFVDRMSRVAGGVFDGAADQPGGFGGEADGLRGVFRPVAIAVFEIGGHRQRGRVGDVLRVGQGFGAAYAGGAILPAQRKGQPGAGGREGLEIPAR